MASWLCRVKYRSPAYLNVIPQRLIWANLENFVTKGNNYYLGGDQSSLVKYKRGEYRKLMANEAMRGIIEILQSAVAGEGGGVEIR